MTGRDLYTQLIQFGDLDAPESSVLGWIDMCQKKTSLDLPVVHTVTAVNVTAGMGVNIDTGVFNLISAADGNGNEYPLSSIQVESNRLVLTKPSDLVTIKYSGIASTYSNLDDELTVHPSLHSPMVYYLISMYYDMEGEGDSEESSLAERYYQRWLYYRNLAISALTGTDNDTFSRIPVETIDVLPSFPRRYRRDSYYE